VILYGAARAFDVAVRLDASEHLNLILLVLIIVIVGGLVGYWFVNMWAAITHWAAGFFEETGTTVGVRAASLWSNIPWVISYIFLDTFMLVYGEGILRSVAPQVFREPYLYPYIISTLHLLLIIWSLIIYIVCLKEVFQFNIWRTIGTMIIAEIGWLFVKVIIVMPIWLIFMFANIWFESTTLFNWV